MNDDAPRTNAFDFDHDGDDDACELAYELQDEARLALRVRWHALLLLDNSLGREEHGGFSFRYASPETQRAICSGELDVYEARRLTEVRS